MADRKRKAAGAKEPGTKRQKVSEEEELKQEKKVKKEISFNKKRLRFITDTQKIRQGSEGLLYWMSRDQRVQGKPPSGSARWI